MTRFPSTRRGRTLPRMRIALLLPMMACILTASAGCSEPRVPDPCPETANTRCLTAPACEVDKTRGCTKCRCSDPYEIPPVQTDPRPAK